jgi:hypothetical protein
MANVLLGEVDLPIGDVRYRLVFDANAFVFAEEALAPQTTDEIVERLMRTRAKADMKLIRGLFWAGLQEKHPRTLKEAGQLLSEAGFPAVRDAVVEGMKAAFGTAEDKEPGDPPSPEGGTGTG